MTMDLACAHPEPHLMLEIGGSTVAQCARCGRLGTWGVLRLSSPPRFGERTVFGVTWSVDRALPSPEKQVAAQVRYENRELAAPEIAQARASAASELARSFYDAWLTGSPAVGSVRFERVVGLNLTIRQWVAGEQALAATLGRLARRLMAVEPEASDARVQDARAFARTVDWLDDSIYEPTFWRDSHRGWFSPELDRTFSDGFLCALLAVGRAELSAHQLDRARAAERLVEVVRAEIVRRELG
jgi:hypothetical protein